MTFIIVTRDDTVVGKPVASFCAALIEATRLFGDNTQDWLNLNLRIEENR